MTEKRKNELVRWSPVAALILSLLGDAQAQQPNPDGAKASVSRVAFAVEEKCSRSLNYLIPENLYTPYSAFEMCWLAEAEALYLQGRYPAAAASYVCMLNAYPATTARAHVATRLFDIANYWLHDTRLQMSRSACSSSWDVFANLLHFDETKPLVDEEGYAVALLDFVANADPESVISERALYYSGAVCFYREQYAIAEERFTKIIQTWPDGDYAPPAIVGTLYSRSHLAKLRSQTAPQLITERGVILRVWNNCPDIWENHEDALAKRLKLIARELAELGHKKH